MNIIKYLGLILFGFGSGVVISAGVFSLIATIGIVPRMAEKTKTVHKIPLYEDSITLGGVIGTLALFINFSFPMGKILVAVFSLCIGVFFGELAVSIAEVLNVFPIFMRRFRLKTGLAAFIPAMALGKCVGSLMYFLITGFYSSF
ncbi:hypothetical protein IMSAG049_00712 [Clostridiales bacterium]|nr:hypothetical protein IMSAG049_00712 [Clostridiales bacterium]